MKISIRVLYIIVLLAFGNSIKAQNHSFKQFSIQLNPILSEVLATNNYEPYFYSNFLNIEQVKPIVSIAYTHPINEKWQIQYEVSYRKIDDYLEDARNLKQVQYAVNVGKLNSSSGKYIYTYLGLGANFSTLEIGEWPGGWPTSDNTPFGKDFFGLELRGGKNLYHTLLKKMSFGYGLRGSLGYYTYNISESYYQSYQSFYFNLQLTISLGFIH